MSAPTSNPESTETQPAQAAQPVIPLSALTPATPVVVREIGGRRDGPDPTRYGDWEKNGRCIDF